MEQTSLAENKAASCDRPRRHVDDSGLRQLIGYQLRRAEMAMQQQFSLTIGVPFGLRQAEFFALMLLAGNRVLTHKQISDALAIAPSNMVGIMAGLATRELVARRANPADGRSFLWTLTVTGGDLVERAANAVARTESRAVDATGPTRDEVARALDGLWSGGSPEA